MLLCLLRRFYHLSRFHTRISLTWLHFPCVCRSQIARGRRVRKRPDGQSGKWSNPWRNKVHNPSPLPQGPGEWGDRQSDAGEGTSSLAESCRNSGQKSIFGVEGTGNSNFQVVNLHYEIWYHPPYALEMSPRSSPWTGVLEPQSLTMPFSLPIPCWETKWNNEGQGKDGVAWSN